jgi:aspartate--ammonia ligase
VKKKATNNGPLPCPPDYTPALGLRETEVAIKHIKDTFERRLARALNLTRVSAPIVVSSRTGVNDHLDGTQLPVRIRVKALGEDVEIVQSLAKWKRAALADYGFRRGEGLYTDMNAIRPDERLDCLHSIYVDQWDWELMVSARERNTQRLRQVVRSIYRVIRGLEQDVCRRWPALPGPCLPAEIWFAHSRDLEERYPALTPREREDAICREHGAVFVIGIGAPLRSGAPHDARAADYDDWITAGEGGKAGLNGDILVWYPVLNRALELSSMGIRVDAASLRRQLRLHGETAKARLPFHRKVLRNELPLTMGGGIGQSRLCMLLLRKAHVGEVQSAVWPAAMSRLCRKRGIRLL